MIEKGRVISLISSAAGLLLAVGSMTVFSACGPKEDGTLMICHNAQIRVAMCGIGLAVLFAIAAFVKSKAIKLICDTAALVLSVVTFMSLNPLPEAPRSLSHYLPCGIFSGSSRRTKRRDRARKNKGKKMNIQKGACRKSVGFNLHLMRQPSLNATAPSFFTFT